MEIGDPAYHDLWRDHMDLHAEYLDDLDTPYEDSDLLARALRALKPEDVDLGETGPFRRALHEMDYQALHQLWGHLLT